MNRYLAWFITFNFINFSWVFFRAKDWDDALKVLYGMSGGNRIVLPEFLHKVYLSFLPISYGNITEHLNLGRHIFVYIILALILIFFKNSNYYHDNFKPDNKSAIFISIIFIYTIVNMRNFTEFLYFNF